MKSKSALSILFAAGLALFWAAPAQAQQVDLAIVLAADISGSISTTEFNLQREGYARAFESSQITSLFDGTLSVAVAYTNWANQAKTVLDWTILDSAADSTAFGSSIRSSARANGIGDFTHIDNAIDDAVSLIFTEGVGDEFTAADRYVVDVSGDGRNNSVANSVSNPANIPPLTGARDAAITAGVDTINGLVILNNDSGLGQYYEDYVIAGTNQDGSPAFVLGVNDFDDFEQAMITKLKAEITGVGPIIPEPSTVGALSLLGMVGFLGYRRFRKSA